MTGVVYSRSPGEALAEAARRAAESLSSRLARAVEDAAELLERLRSRGLLHRVEPRRPRGSVYGLDGSLARLPLGSSTLLVLLHAAAVPAPGPGEPLHAAAALLLPAAGPDAEQAMEASMIMLETLLLERLLAGASPGLVVLDGPLVDPPWEPQPGPLVEEAGRQLLGTPAALLGLHEKRASLALEAGPGRLVGVAKRRTGPGPLAAETGLPGDDAAAAAVAAGLRRLRFGGWAAVGPWRLGGGVYSRYPGVETAYLFSGDGSSVLRVEVLGDALAAAAAAASLTPPGAPAPAAVLLAHRAARVPRGLLDAAARLLAARGLEAAGDAALLLLRRRPR